MNQTLANEIDFAEGQTGYEYFVERYRHSEADGLRKRIAVLAAAKKQLPHELFKAFCKDPRLDIGIRMAQHMANIDLAEDRDDLISIGVTKAIQVLGLTLEQRKRLFADHKVESLSVSELRAIVDATTGKRRKSPKRKHSVELVFCAGVLHLAIDDISITSVETAHYTLGQIFQGARNDGFLQDISAARAILLKDLGAHAAPVNKAALAVSYLIN